MITWWTTIALGLSLAGLQAAGPVPGTPLVEIDGVRLTLSDLEKRSPTALFQARNAFHEAHRKAIEEFVEEYLLERQAQRENLTVSALLERHVNGAAGKNPSEEALRVYYEGLDTKEPFEAVREKILDVVRQRRLTKARAEYLKTLRSQARIEVLLGPPRAPISMKGSPLRGSPAAPVVLVEFADYECPYCQKAQPLLERLRTEFPDKLAFVYKDVPLPMHPRAQKASEAARCAGEQGKYWEFHDWLFRAQQLDLADLKTQARSLQLDAGKFDKCLDSGSQAARVQADLNEAQALGLPGTPAFFVNGRLLNPTAPATYEALKKAVEEELGAVRAAEGGGKPGSQSAAARN